MGPRGVDRRSTTNGAFEFMQNLNRNTSPDVEFRGEARVTASLPPFSVRRSSPKTTGSEGTKEITIVITPVARARIERAACHNYIGGIFFNWMQQSQLARKLSRPDWTKKVLAFQIHGLGASRTSSLLDSFCEIPLDAGKETKGIVVRTGKILAQDGRRSDDQPRIWKWMDVINSSGYERQVLGHGYFAAVPIEKLSLLAGGKVPQRGCAAATGSRIAVYVGLLFFFTKNSSNHCRGCVDEILPTRVSTKTFSMRAVTKILLVTKVCTERLGDDERMEIIRTAEGAWKESGVHSVNHGRQSAATVAAGRLNIAQTLLQTCHIAAVSRPESAADTCRSAAACVMTAAEKCQFAAAECCRLPQQSIYMCLVAAYCRCMKSKCMLNVAHGSRLSSNPT
ncbi:hypothetical protein DFH06DRAFT_1136914 [Mycena polygramma]|nr:hypothetical protein DFH06DRAFT_1136914 [Mycena polygramma]